MMNLNQLWIFYNVAKLKGFSLAAEALFLTQPSISTQVKLLENSYNIKLFERFGKKIELTNHGQVLFSYAEKIFNLTQEADSVIEDLKGMKGGNLKIDTSLTLGAYYLSDILTAFNLKFPNIKIQMRVGNTQKVVENVLTFKTDLGFIGQIESHEKLVVLPFIEEELVIIVPPSHEFAGQKTIKLSRLNGQPFIMRGKGSMTREEVEKIFKKERLSVNVRMELESNEAIKRAVEDGLGISIISANVVKREVEAGLLKIVRLSGEKVTRNFSIIYHKDKYLSNIIQSFLKIATEYSHRYYH
ncbi:MAG: selenium metabolism-associated LysR family transcriptional regulator [Thermodesulfobacteriota bacterium]|nr:selenium metabolism-associated LysR family transcriptional regulator [Thermodesulfobacteriota bacterium]